MFHTLKRILDIAGDQKKYIYAGIVCNILKTFSMAMMLMAVYVVISHLDSLTTEVIGQGLGILIASVFGRFLFQWLEDISMSAKGFDIFRDYRLAIGEKMKSAPMGYFSDQRLGTIQTTLTPTVVELEQYSMLFITDITGGVSMSVIIIVMMLFFSPWFSLLSLVGLLVGLYVLGMVQKAAAEHTPKVQEARCISPSAGGRRRRWIRRRQPCPPCGSIFWCSSSPAAPSCSCPPSSTCRGPSP